MSGPCKFKKNFSLEDRKAESNKILTKYPDKIPVIVSKYPKCKNVDDINKNKFLVPGDLTLSQFIYVVKKRISLQNDMSLYVFLDDETMPTSSSTLSNLYNTNKDEDGFLYLQYASENTFGC